MVIFTLHHPALYTPSVRSTYVRVILIEAAIIGALVIFGRLFS